MGGNSRFAFRYDRAGSLEALHKDQGAKLRVHLSRWPKVQPLALGHYYRDARTWMGFVSLYDQERLARSVGGKPTGGKNQKPRSLDGAQEGNRMS